jgi:hypothetical protein
MVSMTEVDRGTEQTKDYQFGICCFSAKHTALRKKSKDLLAQTRKNNVKNSQKKQMNGRCIYVYAEDEA